MNSDSMPKELDVFISILGEIDMIKNQLGMLDKNTHISLSQNNVSAMLGNSECFARRYDVRDLAHGSQA